MSKHRMPRKPIPRGPDPPGVTMPQGEPPRQLDTTAILWDMHARLTRIEENQGAMADEIRDIKSVQREQAQAIDHMAEAQEHAAVEHERAHGELKAEISALGATVAGLVADKERTPPPNGGASAGRKEDLLTTSDRFLKFAKEWGPIFMKGAAYILAALGTLWGAMYAYASTVATKGAP